MIACCSEYRKALDALKALEKEIYSTTDNYARIKTKFWDSGNRIVASPLTSNQIESKLKFILENLRKAGAKVIFVFDELDKLSGGTADKKEVNLDLIKESKLRKQQVDSILGDLKNLITNSHARYIFIAGRDMYDAYLSERGNSNSLYESLFNDYIYISSLLTDHSDGEVYLLDSMIEAFVVSNLIPGREVDGFIEKKVKLCVDEGNKKYSGKEIHDEINRELCEKEIDLSCLKLSDYREHREPEIKECVSKKYKEKIEKYENAHEQIKDEQVKKEYRERIEKLQDKKKSIVESKLKEEVYVLKTLIHFLTLHSWGNCKRLFTLFESFVRNKGKDDYELYFSTQDMRRLILSSQLYILFHNSLSRMLMNADDKLVVSSFSIFHYILKYHGIGFSREHILRMYETINIHSSPELTRIVDIIIHNVLMNHVRRIRNSFYQYRFTFLHEKEIHFITTINDGESAAFNFSLNAMDAVKRHYKNLIVESKQTYADERYGHAVLASIHVIVGNFHFWEQSFDEASIHYGVALDMLEKNGGLTRNIENMDLLLQMVEIYLKQGAAAERVSNYSAAAASYLNAEILSNDCLKKLNGKVNDRDSKWDILRQPKWAKEFLNLKQSIQDKPSDLIKGELTDVAKYRKAVLIFFMEDFENAYKEFIGVINFLDRSVLDQRQGNHHTFFSKQWNDRYHGYENERDSERTYFLKGNAYLKAGFSLFLQFSSNLHMELKAKDRNFNRNFRKNYEEENKKDDDAHSKLKYEFECNKKLLGNLSFELIKTIDEASKGIDKITSLDKFEYINDNEAKKQGAIYQIIRLLNLSALSFKRGKLNFNAAMSYFSMVMVWEAFLEALPWEKYKNKYEYKYKYIDEHLIKCINVKTKYRYKKIQRKIEKIQKIGNNWIFEAQQKAFEFTGLNTGEAYHHFMKSVLEKNLGKNIGDSEFFLKDLQRERILKNTELLFQHYSLFGQVMAASIYWEEMATNYAMGGEAQSDQRAQGKTPVGLLRGTEDNKLLPYGIRHYSMMLWLKGRAYLGELIKEEGGESPIKNSPDSEQNKSSPEPEILPQELKIKAANAIICLFRSSQYVIKTHGEASNMILPPLFVIYYNMWEVLIYLVDIYLSKLLKKWDRKSDKANLLTKAIYSVRGELHSLLSEENIKDVSSRVLDLLSVEQMALDQFKIIERMGDPSSSDRKSILKNKYYLDDDYEDNMFILDWSYCRFFAPGAMIYPIIIKKRMISLRLKCFEKD